MESITLRLAITTTLLLLVLTSTPCINAARSSPTSSFITLSCQTANYPQLCITSLSTHASTIRNDPLQLTKTSVSVTLDAAKSAISLLSRLSRSGAMTPREKAAVGDCAITVGDAATQLQKSLEAMARGGKRGARAAQAGDAKTWVSAALTDENMCLEGFKGRGLEGDVKRLVKREIDNVVKLTSNALVFVNKLSTATSSP
ncbi:21 kDa protein-like [Typha latifolia]|uniref:21 kDa protein-like n=1 Tax=Typha latifolia TaxID=4733 RepID=UPI003C2F32B3